MVVSGQKGDGQSGLSKTLRGATSAPSPPFPPFSKSSGIPHKPFPANAPPRYQHVHFQPLEKEMFPVELHYPAFLNNLVFS